MLDSDICSYIIQQRPLSVHEAFQKVKASELCISVITQAELLFGVACRPSQKNNREVVENFIGHIVVLDWDGEAARAYAVLRAALEAKGNPIGAMDLMIAAHALSIEATMVTNNVRHFAPVPRLKTVNWT